MENISPATATDIMARTFAGEKSSLFKKGKKKTNKEAASASVFFNEDFSSLSVFDIGIF